MIEAMRRVAEEIGRTPSAENRTDASYSKYRRADEPAASTIIARFGNWNEALAAAGLSLNSGRRSAKREKRFSDQSLLNSVALMAAKYPRLTVQCYDEHKPEGFPGSAIIRRRLRRTVGTWTDIVAAVGGASGPAKLHGSGKQNRGSDRENQGS
jgi:hypothetical protein